MLSYNMKNLPIGIQTFIRTEDEIKPETGAEFLFSFKA